MPGLDRKSALEYLARAAFNDFDELNTGTNARASSLRRFDAWCDEHEAKSDAELAELVALQKDQVEQDRARDVERKAAEAAALCDFATAIEWSQWAILPQVRLWEAIALMVGVNPKSLRPVRARGWSRPYFDGFICHEQETRFHEALDFVERAALGPDAQHAAIGEAPIDLKRVALFFVKAGWSGMSAEMQLLGEREASIEAALELAKRSSTEAAAAHESAAGVPEKVVAGSLGSGARQVATSTNSRTASIVHATQNRRNVLDPVLDEAERLALNPADRAAVWNALVALAQAKPPTPPLIGFSEGEVKFRDSDGDGVKCLDRAAFNRRFDRRAKKAALGR